MSRLASAHATLQKLQFVLELPNKLKECLAEGRPDEAVRFVPFSTNIHYSANSMEPIFPKTIKYESPIFRCYLKAGVALEHYRHMPSFTGIQEDCESIMTELTKQLRGRLEDPSCQPEQLAEAVQLLRQLGEPTEHLCDSYLSQAAVKLDDHLVVLEQQASMAEERTQTVGTVALMDPLEFVDQGCNNFLADLCLAATGKRKSLELDIRRKDSKKTLNIVGMSRKTY